MTERGGPESSILLWARSTETGQITAIALLTFGSAWWGFLSFVAWWRPSVMRDGFAPFSRTSGAAPHSWASVCCAC